MVGLPIVSCQCSTGSWLVMIVEPRPFRHRRGLRGHQAPASLMGPVPVELFEPLALEPPGRSTPCFGWVATRCAHDAICQVKS